MKKTIFTIFMSLIFIFNINAISGSYSVGDEAKYNNIDFYVLTDTDEYVTLIKTNSLTTEEVKRYYSGWVNDSCGRVKIPIYILSKFDNLPV